MRVGLPQYALALRACAVLIVALLPALAGPGAVAAAPSVAGQEGAASVQTIRRFSTSEPVVVLTFDAGADRGYAGSILDTLAAKGVSASFGMTGEWALQNPDLIARIAREGHHFINHTWSHRSFTGLSTGAAPLTSAQRADELRRTENLIRSQVGVELQPYFRPPYGDYDDSVLADLGANGYGLNIMWTIDTLGWRGLTAAQITQRTLDATVPGAIVLMHVGAQSQDGPALPGMIDQLRARGYRFATVRDFLPGRVYFPETGHSLGGRFLSYWEASGGLPVFGYPLTDEAVEPGSGLTAQYFERQRFERHPENGAPYDVLLGLLGRTDAERRGLAGGAPFRPLPAGTGSDANCAFFPETGHRLCHGFRAYWQGHGLNFGDPGTSYRESLALFGYPISEEFRLTLEDGREYTVQYFERARFEWHPENAAPYDILLGRLGVEVLPAR